MNHKILFIISGVTETERGIMRGVFEYSRDFGPWDISIFSAVKNRFIRTDPALRQLFSRSLCLLIF